MGKVLHFAYNYFELEGIPPYTSPFTPVDFRYEWWVDRANTQRFRFEKQFATRLAPIKTGIMILSTSTGPTAKIVQTDVWDGQSTLLEKSHPHPQQSYDAWLEAFTTMGRKLVSTIGQADAKFAYLGLQTDQTWGQVYAFQSRETVHNSDMYDGLPLLITHKIHGDDYRWIEMEQNVESAGASILFRLLRLADWGEVDSDDLLPGMFEQ